MSASPPKSPTSDASRLTKLKKSLVHAKLLCSGYVRLLFYKATTFDKVILFLGSISAIAAGVPFPILGIIFGKLVDDFNTTECYNQNNGDFSESSDSISSQVLIIVYLTIGNFFLIYIYLFCWDLVGEKLALRLRKSYLDGLLQRDVAFFDGFSSGTVSSRLNIDIQSVQNGTSQKVGVCMATLSFFVTSYAIAFIKFARLAGMLVALVPALMVVSLLGSTLTARYAGSISEQLGAIVTYVSEAFDNISIIHAYTLNQRLEARLEERLRQARVAGIRKAIVVAVQVGLVFFFGYSANALAFWQGAKAVARTVSQNGEGVTVGATFTVVFLLVDASIILSQIAPFFQIFASATAAFNNLQLEMNGEELRNGRQNQEESHFTNANQDLTLDDVSFTYPARPDQVVLKHVSLTLFRNQHTAIVGASGSGKSTILDLIMKLYEPSEGQIRIGSLKLEDINPVGLRKHIGVVRQDPVLFPDRTILGNITLGLIGSASHPELQESLQAQIMSDISVALSGDGSGASVLTGRISEIASLVREASIIADIYSFVQALPEGFNTILGSTDLSGGQKQRIALSRALLRDPTILILDEATSALDAESEGRIYKALSSWRKGRTMVSITHRLSTIQDADNITVLSNGVIMEQGSHVELMNRRGVYTNMVKLQSFEEDRKPVLLEKIELSEGTELVAAKTASPAEAELTGSSSTATYTNPETTSRLQTAAFLLKPYSLPMILGLVGSVIVGGMYSAEAVIFGNAVQDLRPCRQPSQIVSSGHTVGLWFFLLGIIEFLANSIGWVSFSWVAEHMVSIMRRLTFRSILEQPAQWHRLHAETRLGTVVTDTNVLTEIVGSAASPLVSMIVNIVAAIVLSHIVAWRIAVVCLVTVPLLVAVGLLEIRSIESFQAKHEAAYVKAHDIAVHAVKNIKTLTCMTIEPEILRTFRRALDVAGEEVNKACAYKTIWLTMAYCVPNFVYALAYWWGAKNVAEGRYSTLQFFIVLISLLVSAQLWSQAFVFAPEILKARRALKRIIHVMGLGSTSPGDDGYRLSDEEKAESSCPKAVLPAPAVSVDFRNVGFTYPLSTQQILNGLNISISAGQSCALIGPSGAGKSTIIALLERFYHPESGVILIDGQNISKQNSLEFRDQISLITQDNFLFSGSIKENVELGARPNQEVTEAEIVQACRMASIHDDIEMLPDKYETQCGQNGNQLSGGQKQRICLARGLLRKPRLLLLDESTSALDAASESTIRANLQNPPWQMTIISIAHRLHTVLNSDVIFMIDAGRCSDYGTHEALMERNVTYQSNVQLQSFA